MYVVTSPEVEYPSEVVQPGEDSYTYDIFFTGKHISNHVNIVPTICTL